MDVVEVEQVEVAQLTDRVGDLAAAVGREEAAHAEGVGLVEGGHRVDERLPDAVRVVGQTRLRVWRLSLALSTVGFERDRIGVHQVLAVRPHADGRSGMLA